MPKCPKCREKIGYLNAEYRSTFIEHYALQGDQAIFEDAGDEPGEYELEGFRCPECGEMLFGTVDDAQAFLRNKPFNMLSERERNMVNDDAGGAP